MRQEDVAVLLALVMAIMLLHALAVGTYKSRRCAKRVPSETCSVVDLPFGPLSQCIALIPASAHDSDS